MASILICPVEISQTASSGIWAFNTPKFSGCDLRQIIIKAATSDTTFDITITDDYDNIVYSSEGNTGSLNELLYLPLRGVYTVALVNSSVENEVYTGRLMIEE